MMPSRDRLQAQQGSRPGTAAARRQGRRGGVLVTVLIFSAVIAIGLTSYVRVATSSYQLAHRTYLDTVALSLAEAGLEHGLSAFNQIDSLGELVAFNGWATTVTGLATTTLDTFNLGNGVTGVVKVQVTGLRDTVATPLISAKAVITPPGGPGVTRYLQVSLRRRTVFLGMLSTGNINVQTLVSYFAAWNSLPNGSSQPAVGFAESLLVPSCFIGTVGAGTSNFRGALIYGRIANSSSMANISHSSSAVLASALGGSGWDTALYSNTLSVNVPVPEAPALPAVYNVVSSDITTSTTFPRGGDQISANGNYYYVFQSGVTINLSGIGKGVRIAGNSNCVFMMHQHAGTDAIKLSGLATFTVQRNSTLRIYTDGNIDCEGLIGISNANDSSTSLVIYGTNPNPGGQTFSFFGIGAFLGSLNAPNADVNWTGLNLWLGAIVARNITFSIAGGFIYDIAMARYSNTSTTGSPWGISQWTDMATEAQRLSIASLFNF